MELDHMLLEIIVIKLRIDKIYKIINWNLKYILKYR
jgi:hypothetical protein